MKYLGEGRSDSKKKVWATGIIGVPSTGEIPASAMRNAQPSARIWEKSRQEAIVNVLGEGQAVKHDQYGLGIVTESNSERTVIDFDDHGSKKFVTSIWTAELIGEAPEKPTKPRRGGRRKKAAAAAVAAVAASAGK